MLKKYLRRKAINWLARNLLRSITVEDLLRIDPNNGKIVCKGKYVSPELQSLIKDEAEYIKNSTTFQLVMADMEYLAHQAMFTKSNTYDDMLFGKSMLYIVDILKKKISNLAKK